MKNTGPIAWMARNPVAANLLMIIILVAGMLGMTQIKQEVFPEFGWTSSTWRWSTLGLVPKRSSKGPSSRSRRRCAASTASSASAQIPRERRQRLGGDSAGRKP